MPKRNRNIFLENTSYPKAKYSKLNPPMKDQEQGFRTRYSRKGSSGSPYYKPMKALNTGLQRVNMILSTITTNVASGTFKHLVSEYDPTRGGFVSIPKRTYGGTAQDTFACMPMHCYDLNLFLGDKSEDSNTSFPTVAGLNTDNINARHWIMDPLLNWIGTKENINCRYVIDNPSTSTLNGNNNTNPALGFTNDKIYRNHIDMKFMLYGTIRQPIKYDIRVIQITDERFCPDYPLLNNTSTKDKYDVSRGYQNLLTAFTVNPLLSGEPGPVIKPWYKTIAKKIVTVGEQTGNIQTIPSLQTSLRINLNKVNNYAWGTRSFEDLLIANAGNYNDDAMKLTDSMANNKFEYKPHYNQRYYLLIRADGFLDTAPTAANNQDDTDVTTDPAEYRPARPYDDKGHTLTVCQFIPTYDLIVRNVFTVSKS